MSTKSQSIQAGQLLLEKLRTDKALKSKVDATKNYQDFLVVAQKEGFDLTGLSEQEALGLVRGDASALGEISDDDLARVAGGVMAVAGDTQTIQKQPGILYTGGSNPNGGWGGW